MIILGIETSCDETAAAIIKDGKEILSTIIATSVDMHAKTGGIIPEQAAREQVKSILPVVNEALETSHLTEKDIDAIAVTVGPGLIGSLLVGVETARTLAWVWNKPVVPVNHLVGHIFANWLISTPALPALALVVSGGHTDIVKIWDDYTIEWMGGTRDDAAGEAFDKSARLMGLGFPGGPAISKAAALHHQTTPGVKLPRPLLNDKGFDFSFSGLKTAVLREVTKRKELNEWNTPSINQLAYEVQEAITDVLIQKTLRAVKETEINTLLVSGGVAANSRLREKFLEQIEKTKMDVQLHIPPPIFCTDNAAMIATAATYIYKPTTWEQITTDPNLTITSV